VSFVRCRGHGAMVGPPGFRLVAEAAPGRVRSHTIAKHPDTGWR